MPGFDPTITQDGLERANAAAEAAANNPEAFEFTRRAATTGTMFSWLSSLLDTPFEYAQAFYRTLIYYLRYSKHYLQTNAWSIVFMVIGSLFVFTGMILCYTTKVSKSDFSYFFFLTS